MARESASKKKRTSAAGRQDGDYAAPVVVEPRGGPIPKMATRAKDHDGENLKRYWLAGAGLAKWNTWTELRNHLAKYLSPERAKRTAAEWFHERYGFWPGADLNKVRQGKPPRGDRIGPG